MESQAERLNAPEAGNGAPADKPKRRGNPFQPGHPRYGGRKPGSPIKRTEKAREVAEKLGFHPVEFLAKCALGQMPNEDGTTTKLDTAQRLDAAKAVAPYLEAKLAQTQITGAEDGPLTVSLPTQQILNDPDMSKKLSELALMVAQSNPEDSVN